MLAFNINNSNYGKGGKLVNNNLNSELKKEIEMQKERENLNNTINIIKKEILEYINKKKLISKKIVDYRKEILDEYRDDEDKVAEYFDHERYTYEQVFRIIDRKLYEMNILIDSPYYGRIDFTDEDSNESQKIFIGRFGLMSEDNTPLIIDWRAPAAAMFYAGKLGLVEYNTPSGKAKSNILNKRQYIIKNRKLIGMFDSSIEVKDKVLQMVLSKNAGDKLKDIIMTIQKEQDDIIRQPKDKIVIVDGTAGSGKTTIALHRVAYLLYNYRDTLEDKVLILGPNNIFMEYISTVLPSLGETGVRQTTFKDLALDILNIDNIIDNTEYLESIVNKDELLEKNILYKNSLKYKEYLDEYINKLDDEYFKFEDVTFIDKVIITKEEIQQMYHKYYKYMPLFRRTRKIKRIIFSKISEARNEKVKQIIIKYKNKVKSLTKEELELQGSNLDFNKRLEIEEVIKQSMKTKREINWLDNPDCVELYKQINKSDVLIYDDLAPILYLKIKLEGLKLKNEVRHVVIDEAQDYSYLQFLVIKLLTKCNSMTIVGDKNQRFIPYSSTIPMLNLHTILGNKNIEYFNLTKSYRSTRQIMEYANKFLSENNIVPLVRDGEEVKEEYYEDDFELENLLIEEVKDLQEENYESIGIICKNLDSAVKLSQMVNDKIHVTTIKNENIIYKSGLVIMPSYFSKGLEFDAVILVEDNKNKLNSIDNNLKYIMATRALHQLVVLKHK